MGKRRVSQQVIDQIIAYRNENPKKTFREIGKLMGRSGTAIFMILHPEKRIAHQKRYKPSAAAMARKREYDKKMRANPEFKLRTKLRRYEREEAKAKAQVQAAADTSGCNEDSSS